jgi:hypothetical protein
MSPKRLDFCASLSGIEVLHHHNCDINDAKVFGGCMTEASRGFEERKEETVQASGLQEALDGCVYARGSERALASTDGGAGALL